MDKRVQISKFLRDYFYNLDSPPPLRLLVPIDEIEFDEDDRDLTTAILIYVVEVKGIEKVNKAKIEFDSSRMDHIGFDVNYRYIKNTKE